MWNYGEISLLNGSCKLFVKIIAAKLQRTAEVILLEKQPGFRKASSSADNIHVIRQLIQKYSEFS
jgi:hypothetical protein